MKKRMISLLIAICLLVPVFAHAEDSRENDWYLEQAAALAAKLHELIAFENFAEFFTGDPEIIDRIASWATAMDSEPLSVKGYDLPPLELISEFVPDMENIPEALLEKVNRSLGSTLINQINSTIGVNFLAASSMCILSEGYIMPEGFAPCIVVYEYNEVCLSVSFAQIGEDVVLATAQFAAPDLIALLTGSYEE